LQAPAGDVLDSLLEATHGTLRLMTVAPELEGASGVIGALVEAGVRVSVGHTDATFAQARDAFEAGASHITHAFNAMRPLHHREPGPLAAALAFGGVTVEVIADGVHLHPATVALLVKAFGHGRVCLVTDAVSPAGLGEGSFLIGGHEARLVGGSIRLPDGTIAGSAATMDAVVRNCVEWAIASLAETVRMASEAPARTLGLADRKGSLSAGMDADIVALDGEMNVVATWVAGRMVYERG
jgi:N-acetylglucosamine-6-phosphate deacetylase